MSVRGILQAATYKKGANMKCMLFVLGALFGLKNFNHGKKKLKIKIKKKIKITQQMKTNQKQTKPNLPPPLHWPVSICTFSLCGANFAFFYLGFSLFDPP